MSADADIPSSTSLAPCWPTGSCWSH